MSESQQPEKKPESQSPSQSAQPEQPVSQSDSQPKPASSQPAAKEPKDDDQLGKPAQPNGGPRPEPTVASRPDMPSAAPKPKQTDYLDLPKSTDMGDRIPTGATKVLTEASQLVLKVGSDTKKIPVSPRMLIGRATDDEDPIEIDLNPFGAYQGGVSRRHAAITLHDGTLYIVDLNSTNGTRINGAQLAANREYRLRDGDEIEFARLRVVIRFENPAR